MLTRTHASTVAANFAETGARTRVAKGLAWCALLGLAIGGHAHGAEGRIPIFEPVVLDVMNGSISGKYILTRDITTTSDAEYGIEFVGDDTQIVDLDLNGFTITATGAGAPLDAVIYANALKKLVVRNGTIIGDTNRFGLRGTVVTELEVEDVSFENVRGGILVGGLESFTIRDCLVSGATDPGYVGQFRSGIAVSPSEMATAFGVIEGNLVKNMDSSGIHIYNNKDVDGITIRNNQIFDSRLWWGIFAQGVNLIVENNQVTRTGHYGIETRGSGCRVTDNVVREADIGIVVNGSDTLLSGNVIVQSSRAGILVDDPRAVVENNISNENVEAGLSFSAGAVGSLYRGNTFVGNGSLCVDNRGASICDDGHNYCSGSSTAGIPACPPSP